MGHRSRLDGTVVRRSAAPEGAKRHKAKEHAED